MYSHNKTGIHIWPQKCYLNTQVSDLYDILMAFANTRKTLEGELSWRCWISYWYIYTGVVALAHVGNESKPNIRRPQLLMAKEMQPMPIMFITSPVLACEGGQKLLWWLFLFCTFRCKDLPCLTLWGNHKRRQWHLGAWPQATWKRRMRWVCRGSSHTEGSSL